MRWPAITNSYVATNGFVIHPLSSDEEILAHGREISNGLEVPGTVFFEIAAAGGNQVFSIHSPEGELVGSGSLKPGEGDVVFVNFVRGYRNSPIPETSPVWDASKEWAQKINDREIEVFAVPANGRYRAIEVTPQLPAPQDEAPADFVTNAMSAFSRIVGMAREVFLAPVAPAAPVLQEEAEAPLAYINREVGENVWPIIASPGNPNGHNLSVVVAYDEKTLRHIVEATESRMMWDMDRSVLPAVLGGRIQVAGIFDNAPRPDPIIGYAVLQVRNNALVATDIVGRFDHQPTREMIDTVTAWVADVNRLRPEEFSPNGVRKNIDTTFSKFALFDAIREMDVPQYDDWGHMIVPHEFSPGRAVPSLGFGNLRRGPEMLMIPDDDADTYAFAGEDDAPVNEEERIRDNIAEILDIASECDGGVRMFPPFHPSAPGVEIEHARFEEFGEQIFELSQNFSNDPSVFNKVIDLICEGGVSTVGFHKNGADIGSVLVAQKFVLDRSLEGDDKNNLEIVATKAALGHEEAFQEALSTMKLIINSYNEAGLSAIPRIFECTLDAERFKSEVEDYRERPAPQTPENGL